MILMDRVASHVERFELQACDTWTIISYIGNFLGKLRYFYTGLTGSDLNLIVTPKI